MKKVLLAAPLLLALAFPAATTPVSAQTGKVFIREGEKATVAIGKPPTA